MIAVLHLPAKYFFPAKSSACFHSGKPSIKVKKARGIPILNWQKHTSNLSASPTRRTILKSAGIRTTRCLPKHLGTPTLRSRRVETCGRASIICMNGPYRSQTRARLDRFHPKWNTWISINPNSSQTPRKLHFSKILCCRACKGSPSSKFRQSYSPNVKSRPLLRSLTFPGNGI